MSDPARPPAGPSSGGIALGAACALILSIFASFALIIDRSGQPGPAACRAALPYAIGLTAGLVTLTALALVALYGWKRRGFWPDFLRSALVVGTLFFLIPWPCGATPGIMEAFTSCR